MDTLKRSWRLLVASLKLLGRNPRQALLLVVPGTVMFVLVGMILAGGGAYITGHARDSGEAGALAGNVFFSPYFPTGIAAVYLLGSFVTVFFNAALVGCVLADLEGKPCTWRDGLRLAWARRGVILRWSLLYATVVLVLRGLELVLDKLPLLGGIGGKLLLRLAGVAWSLVTFLIVPVIVFEDQPDLWARVRRAGELCKRTWGEQVAGRVGMGAALAVLAGLSLLLVTVLIVALAFVLAKGFGVSESAGLPLIAGLLFTTYVAVLVGYPLLGVALNAIYSAVLYSYAVTGMLPQEFSPDLLPPTRKT